MNSGSAELVELVPSAGPELLAAIVLFVIITGGLATSIVLLRRGQVTALSLAGIFGLLAVGVVFALAHIPTKLVVGAHGIQLGIGPFNSRWRWIETGPVEVHGSGLGFAMLFEDFREHRPRSAPFWFAQRIRLFVPGRDRDPAALADQIRRWRHAPPP